MQPIAQPTLSLGRSDRQFARFSLPAYPTPAMTLEAQPVMLPTQYNIAAYLADENYLSPRTGWRCPQEDCSNHFRRSLYPEVFVVDTPTVRQLRFGQEYCYLHQQGLIHSSVDTAESAMAIDRPLTNDPLTDFVLEMLEAFETSFSLFDRYIPGYYRVVTDSKVLERVLLPHYDFKDLTDLHQQLSDYIARADSFDGLDLRTFYGHVGEILNRWVVL
jgi:hypothetical protein